MPSSCLNEIACPQYQPFVDAAKEDQKARETREKKEKDDFEASEAGKAVAALEGIKLTTPLQTPQEKCAAYCLQVQKAEEERCRILREKVNYALEQAGCPSTIGPRTTTTSTAAAGCTSCQFGTSAIPSSVPSFIQFSSSPDSNAATAGSCSNGMCTR